MATEGNVNAPVFLEFLKRLIHKATRPVFLIVDNHSVHHSSEVREFVQNTKGKLWLFFLLPYSAELNPEEHVWNYLKNHKIGRQCVGTGLELNDKG